MGFQRREAREVAVGGPKFVDPVVEAQGGDSRIVNAGTADLSCQHAIAKALPVIGGLAEENQAWRLEPSFDLIDGGFGRRGRAENAGMRYDGQELMHDWPRNRPLGGGLGQGTHCLGSWLVPGRILAVGVDENVVI